MTLVFFLGFSVSFVSMGVIAGTLGYTALSVIQPAWLVRIAAVAIIIFGIMTLLGKGISSFVKFRVHSRNDIEGTFLLGIFFAVGWSACLGPILAGILGIGAVLGNPVLSGFLLFAYSLGNLLPLFVLSVFYDRFNLGKSRLIRGRILHFSLMGEGYEVHSTNLISGVLFLVLGGVMLAYNGTAALNALDPLRLSEFFYSGQNALISWKYSQIAGIMALAVFAIGVGWFLWKRKKDSE